MNNKELDNVDVYDVALAAFLHDIGKFIQRAGEKRFYDESQKEYFCKKYKEGYSHLHTIYTYKFLDINKNLFPDIFKMEKIIYIAAKHHQPDKVVQNIVSKADILSSGMDRMKKENESEEKYRYYEQPLVSHFSKIKFDKKDKSTEDKYYNLSVLNNTNVFPEDGVKLSREKYNSFFKEFENEFKQCFDKKSEFNINNNYRDKYLFLQSLDSLVEKYTWCIPSSTVSEPDISLYDHLYTTAAFASVIFKYFELNNLFNKKAEIEKSIKNDKEEKFLLVSGDISGIQKSIFELNSSEDSAKILRGRSFEIQALTELASTYILDQLKLPHFCKIINAGGRFILLLPNHNEIIKKIEDIKVEFEKYFLKKYFGELTLILSEPIKFKGDDFYIDKGEKGSKEYDKNYFDILQYWINEAKFKKFSSILNYKNHIFSEEYNNIKSNRDICPICGKRSKKNNSEYCDVCYQQIKLGKELPWSKYFYIIQFTNDLNREKYSNYLNFVNNYIFVQTKDEKQINTLFKKEEGFFIISKFHINGYKKGFKSFYTPFYLPEDDNGNILTFEELSQKSEGNKKIAMLKSDVDNLGAIFNVGFGKNISISRYSALSRMLNFFFSSYINYSISKNKDNENFKNLYTVFSGGDDLVLIGPWDIIIDYSIFIEKRFKEFVCSNKNITISSGISIIRPNLPVKYIAENAEEYLELSKMRGKNKITVFNTSVEWDRFEKLINKDAQMLLKYYKNLNENKEDKKSLISTSLLYAFLYYNDAYSKINDGTVKIKDLDRIYLWKSHLYYKIERAFKDEKNVENKKLKEELIGFVENNIKVLKIPVSYVLYLKRSLNK